MYSQTFYYIINFFYRIAMILMPKKHPYIGYPLFNEHLYCNRRIFMG